MSLLHPLTPSGQRGQEWEVGALARAAGVPPLPDFKLPPLPPLGGCDLVALGVALGPVAKAALQAQFADPAIRALLTGDLQAKRAQLVTYLSTLTTQKTALNGQISTAGNTQGVNNTSQTSLRGIRTTLGAAPTAPLPPDTMSRVATACPAAAGLLAYSENVLDTLGGQIAGSENFIGTLTTQLASLNNLQAAGVSLLAELDSRLASLPALFTALGGP